MQDLKLILTKFIVKRRLEGGEFTYVLRPRDQSITGKKPILNLLKENQNIYSKLKEECEWTESDEELDSQLLKIIPLLPYEEDTIPAIAKTKQKKKGNPRIKMNIWMLMVMMTMTMMGGIQKNFTCDISCCICTIHV